jgi:hypothetical protein
MVKNWAIKRIIKSKLRGLYSGIGIGSDEQASGMQGVSPQNDQRQKDKAPEGALIL